MKFRPKLMPLLFVCMMGCSSMCGPEGLEEGWVRIPAGTFTMGSPPDEIGREPDREEQFQVTITRDFFMMAHEVTHAQWRELMGELNMRFDKCGEQCPVESVSWYEALTYANALSRQRGLQECYELANPSGTIGSGCNEWIDDYYCFGDFKYETVKFAGLDCEGYRLPTEAEWEYAARAGTTTITYLGDSEVWGDCMGPDQDRIAWYCSTVKITDRGPKTVMTKEPNSWGLHDMLGNLYEWVWDRSGWYPKEPQVDFLGAEYHEPHQRRSNRGADWSNRADEIRPAHRRGHRPYRRGDDTGFRLARTASPSTVGSK